ncbi:hypothetical protein [Actinoplanes sp. NBRC 103695]|uniref:hypothetical protein n=1 Tax=Actinoplanes sp. NBRC 103695 TaxID=3032202 RepID=UPI0024A481E8|nr:hypothetical protein [Actinoplanes sp. NBRC 103695]GLY97641.1 hypothetical protein Acsp02_48950 [Actinoplanes sp. NBRC 103695]
MTDLKRRRRRPAVRWHITRVCRPDTGLGYSRPIDNGNTSTPVPEGVALFFFTGRCQEANR